MPIRYLQSGPMVFGSTRAYASAWEATFGKKVETPVEPGEAQRNNRRRTVLRSIRKGSK